MPRISDFYNIVVLMYWNDHLPAHFHATYKEQEALIEIAPLFEGRFVVYAGSLPNRALEMVKEWALLHKVALQENWDACRQGKPPVLIPPLE